MYIQPKDHPRLRGEKCMKLYGKVYSLGSPPLTRGKDNRAHVQNNTPRITPAYAGKRLSIVCWLLYSKDHPRLRGEKQLT